MRSFLAERRRSIRVAAEIYFGPFRLDLRAGELFKGATRMRVQQHPLRLLQLLIDAQGMLVTREEIRSRLWPNGTIVDFEHSINSAINKLRAVLADTADICVTDYFEGRKSVEASINSQLETIKSPTKAQR